MCQEVTGVDTIAEHVFDRKVLIRSLVKEFFTRCTCKDYCGKREYSIDFHIHLN